MKFKEMSLLTSASLFLYSLSLFILQKYFALEFIVHTSVTIIERTMILMFDIDKHESKTHFTSAWSSSAYSTNTYALE